MRECSVAQHSASLLQHGLDLLVCCLHVDPVDPLVRHVVGEPAGVINWAGQHPALLNHLVLHARVVIFLSEGRGLVDNSGTAVVLHIPVSDDSECSGAEALAVFEVIKDRNVFRSCQFGPLGLFENLHILLLVDLQVFLRAQPGQTTRGHNKRPIGCLLRFDVEVFEFWIHTKREVGGKGPGCGCPREKLDRGILDRRKCDDHRRIRNVLLVVQIGFKVG
mmetsp:Transcript_5336/g.10561  ORF Transcript_5336/g.10561 Transcript_5336/m.10561 type:complete len:220 (+) Transcript_5336:2537-3196(+)